MPDHSEEFPGVPEGMTPEKLRSIAAWIDTYERLIETHVNMVEALHKRGLIKHSGDHDEVRRIIAGTEVQDDLLRWADAIEASLSDSSEEAHDD